MNSLLNGGFNSNILFAILLIAVGLSSLYHLWLKREKGRFSGKIVLIIVSAILVLAGIALFVMGILYALPTIAI